MDQVIEPMLGMALSEGLEINTIIHKVIWNR